MIKKTKPKNNIEYDDQLLELLLKDKIDTEDEEAMQMYQKIYDILTRKNRESAVIPYEELEKKFQKDLETPDLMDYHQTITLARNLQQDVPYDETESLMDKAIQVLKQIQEQQQQSDDQDGKPKTKQSRRKKSDKEQEEAQKGRLRSEVDNIENNVGKLDDTAKKVLEVIMKSKFETINQSSLMKLIEDIEGEYKKVRQISDYSEIYQANIEDIGSPDFLLKLAEDELSVNVNAKTEKENKRIIVILDRSGSMTSGIKIKIVNAILSYLLNKVKEEQITLSIFGYDYDIIWGFKDQVTEQDLLDNKELTHLHYSKTEKEIYETLKNITHNDDIKKVFKTSTNLRYGGGDTFIHDIMVKLQKEYVSSGTIFTNMFTEKEIELLLICDGEDSVEPIEPMFKTNVITIGKKNEDIHMYANKSGGLSIHLPERESQLND